MILNTLQVVTRSLKFYLFSTYTHKKNEYSMLPSSTHAFSALKKKKEYFAGFYFIPGVLFTIIWKMLQQYLVQSDLNMQMKSYEYANELL